MKSKNAAVVVNLVDMTLQANKVNHLLIGIKYGRAHCLCACAHTLIRAEPHAHAHTCAHPRTNRWAPTHLCIYTLKHTEHRLLCAHQHTYKELPQFQSLRLPCRAHHEIWWARCQVLGSYHAQVDFSLALTLDLLEKYAVSQKTKSDPIFIQHCLWSSQIVRAALLVCGWERL